MELPARHSCESRNPDPRFRGDDIYDVDIYASRMLTRFNWLHRLIFPRLFSRIQVDQDSLSRAKAGLGGSVPIYITTYVGQLEYNFFNYLFLKESLPLAAFANGLTTWQWMPIGEAKKTGVAQLKRRLSLRGKLPHPVSSGYVAGLIRSGRAIFIRLRTTRIHDDLFWDIPEEDIVLALITVQRETDKPLRLISQQFLWAKRPKKAVVRFGEPLDLKDFLDAHPSIPDEEMARILRSTLLQQISHEGKRITGPTIKPRRWMIEKIVESEIVQRQIYTVADEKGKDVEDVRLLALRYAKEMASDISYTYIEYATRIMKWAFNTMYEGIHHNETMLADVRRIAERHPVVFVPNHLSHVDYLLLSTLLYNNNISIPHVAAGINLSFWPVGRIFRRCGAFFIRRTFAGNPIYRAVFESYIRLLISGGCCQEFFIEGGRSRSGKLRQPRMGMLSTIAEAMLERAAPELYFVPTSITYDKVVEEGLHVDELAGREKVKEGPFDIFRLRRYLKRRYGRIYVNFGRPISFRGIESGLPPDIDSDQSKTKIVERIAFEIMNSLNMGAVVTPAALVATALLMEERRGITSEQLHRNIDLLKTYIESSPAQLSQTLRSEPRRSIEDAIERLVSGKTIEAHTDFDPVYFSVAEEKRPSLDFQKNLSISHLLPVAYVSSSLLALMKSILRPPRLKAEACSGLTLSGASLAPSNGSKERDRFSMEELEIKLDFLRSLFMCEFAAHTGLVRKELIIRAVEFLDLRRLISYDREGDHIIINAAGMGDLKGYSSIIKNFIESYKIAFYTCFRTAAGKPMDEKGLIRAMLRYGRHLLLLGHIGRPEAISKAIFENAIRLFRTLGFLIAETPEKDLKGEPCYIWRRSNAALEELQQELELFS